MGFQAVGFLLMHVFQGVQAFDHGAQLPIRRTRGSPHTGMHRRAEARQQGRVCFIGLVARPFAHGKAFDAGRVDDADDPAEADERQGGLFAVGAGGFHAQMGAVTDCTTFLQPGIEQGKARPIIAHHVGFDLAV